MVEMLRMASTRSTSQQSSVGRGASISLQALSSAAERSIILDRDMKASKSVKSAPTGHVVKMGGVSFAVVDLLSLVERHGGAAAVTEQKLWKSIALKLGVNTKIVHNASTRLRVLHDATMNRLGASFPARALDCMPSGWESSDDAAPASSHRQGSADATAKRRIRTLEERSQQTERVAQEVRKRQPRAREARSVKKDSALKTNAPKTIETVKANLIVKKEKFEPEHPFYSNADEATLLNFVGLGSAIELQPSNAELTKQMIAAASSGDFILAGTLQAQLQGKEGMLKLAQQTMAAASCGAMPGSKKGRAKKAKGGTRKGLQKGLQSVSSAVALPDEVLDDVNEITRKELLVEYLAEVGVEKKNLDKVLESYPQLQHLSVIQNLRPTIRFLTKEIGIAPEMVRKVIVSFPQILGLSVKDNLRPTVRYLLDEVGMPMDRLNRTIVTRPQILGCSVDKNLRPKLELLVEMAGVQREQLPNMISRAPHILGYSPMNIARFLIFLLHEIGVEQDRVVRLLTLSPQLLGLSVENNLRPKIRFLVEEVGISEKALGHVIGSFPNILGYSVEHNMRPKLEYLADEMLKVPMAKLGRPLEKCPQLLGYSLEKRIKPRYLLLAKRGLKLGLSRMLAPTDLEFRRILRIHDAQLEEERRATQAAASAIRAYSWAAEAKQGGPEEEGLEMRGVVGLAAAAAAAATQVPASVSMRLKSMRLAAQTLQGAAQTLQASGSLPSLASIAGDVDVVKLCSLRRNRVVDSPQHEVRLSEVVEDGSWKAYTSPSSVKAYSSVGTFSSSHAEHPWHAEHLRASQDALRLVAEEEEKVSLSRRGGAVYYWH
jgi:mTERF domain-containing protein